MGFDDFLREVLGGMGQVMERDDQRPDRLPDSGAAPEPAEAGGIGDVMRAVVQVVGLRQGFFGGMSSVWTGSGTIVDPAGIILTNCHVASPREMGMSAPPADRLAIAVTERSDEPPAISYFADVLATDPELDLLTAHNSSSLYLRSNVVQSSAVLKTPDPANARHASLTYDVTNCPTRRARTLVGKVENPPPG
jgi:hypothetical protein